MYGVQTGFDPIEFGGAIMQDEVTTDQLVQEVTDAASLLPQVTEFMRSAEQTENRPNVPDTLAPWTWAHDDGVTMMLNLYGFTIIVA